MKYIDADQICAKVKQLKEKYPSWQLKLAMDDLHEFIDSLQQDETQVDKMLCSQVWWEEQGWIMIPPDATIEGIDSLLREVKKKLQQEQPELSNEFEIAINRRLNLINGENLTATELLEETKGMAAELLDLACKVIEKEQPEVDLNEEITDKSRSCCNCVNGILKYPNCYCWQHKDCNTDEPYKIHKEDWVETAKVCKEFESELGLNARKV